MPADTIEICTVMEPESVENLRIRWMDTARLLAIISITCNHAVNRVWDNYSNQAGEFSEIGLVSSLLKSVLTFFSHLGVPLFLMLSGALLLKKKIDSFEDVKRFYKRNLLPILITAEIWYFIMYWFIVFFEPGNRFAEASAAKLIWGCMKTMLFMDQVTLGSMWYIPMILLVYLMVPVMCVYIRRCGVQAVLLPGLVMLVVGFFIPNVNSFLHMLLNSNGFSLAVRSSNLMSPYCLYLLIGYCISLGMLNRMSKHAITVGFALLFIACCLYQLWAYSRADNYLVEYISCGTALCAVFLFELIRRNGGRFSEKICQFIGAVSRYSFGIYFVHVVILWATWWYGSFNTWPHFLLFAFLESVSFCGSLIVIKLLSRWSFLRRYLFGIK